MADISLESLQTPRFKAFVSSLAEPQAKLVEAYRAAYQSALDDLAAIYQKAGLDSPRAGKYILRQDAMKYGLLDKRIASMTEKIAELRMLSLKLSAAANRQAYLDGYWATAWSYERAIRARLKLRKPAQAVIDEVASLTSGGMSLADAWKKATIDQAYRVDQEVRRSVNLGRALTPATKKLKEAYDKGLSIATRLLIDEAGRNYSSGYVAARQAATERGVGLTKVWRHSTGLGHDDRQSHIAEDGKYADSNGLFHIDGYTAEAPRMFGIPAEDYNCHCSAYDVITHVDGRLEPKDPNDVLPPLSYRDWYERYVA